MVLMILIIIMVIIISINDVDAYDDLNPFGLMRSIVFDIYGLLDDRLLMDECFAWCMCHVFKCYMLLHGELTMYAEFYLQIMCVYHHDDNFQQYVCPPKLQTQLIQEI